MRGLRASVVAALALLAVFGTTVVGSTAPQGTEEQPFLMALRGERVVINYAAGALDRAVHVQRRLDLLANDFAKWSGQPGLQMRVFVLDRNQWRHFGFLLPYGLPGRVRGTTLALPAMGDSGTIALWTEIQGTPPPPLPGTPMKGTPEEAATLARADLMSEVEAARLLLSMAGVRGTETWLHQVLAHVVARDAFARYEESRLLEITEFFQSLGSGLDTPVSLENYTQGLDLETLMWFESSFHDGARVILDNGKKNEVKALIKLASKNGGALTPELLFQRHPEMKAWLESTYPSSSAG